MGIRDLLEGYLKKWTAYIVVGAVVFTIVIHVAHYFNLLKSFPETVLLETLGVASLILMGLVLETMFSNEKTSADATARITGKLDSTTQRLEEISEQIEAATGIASYSDLSTFLSHWAAIRERYRSLTLVGELPLNYAAEVRWLRSKDELDPGNEMSLYRSLHTRSAKEMAALIDLAAEERPHLVKLYHMYGFDWGSWILGSNDHGKEVEVLLNYANAHGSALTGLRLTGRAAADFVNAITPSFNEVGLSGTSYQSVPLASKEQIDFIVEEKVDYQKKIKEMIDFGVPFIGTDKICEAMIDLLSGTKETLDVTHLCINDGAIARLKDDAFQAWLGANYEAVARKVTIRRIFIVRKADFHHEILAEVRRAMIDRGIQVETCRLDDLKPRLKEDFSIYDGKHLVYMDKSRSYWSGSGAEETLARRTENPELLEIYGDTFSTLMEHRER
jgi:hypothetical protein